MNCLSEVLFSRIKECRLFLSLITAAAFFPGCSQGYADRDPNTLVFWSSNNTHEIRHAEDVVAEWNRLYPETPVSFQPIPEGRSSEEVILAAIVSKSTPDVYSNVWPGVVQQYVEADILVRLDEFADFDSVLHSRIPVSLHDQFRSKNQGIYQFPWKANPIVIYYNKRMLREAGIEVPLKTYSQFMDAASKMTVDLNGNGYADRWMMDVDINTEWWHRFFDFYTLFIAASGGNTFLNPDGSVAFDSPEGVGVFEFLRTGFEKGYFPNAFFQGDVFLQEKVAVHISGPWNIAHLESYKSPDFEYGFMPMPVPDHYSGDVFTYGDPKSLAIFKTAKNPELAWKFIKFMTDKKYDRKLLELTNQIPVRQDLSEDPFFRSYFEARPNYVFFADMIPNIVGVDRSIYLQEMFDIVSQEFDAACVQQLKSSSKGIHDAAVRCRNLVLHEEK